MHSNLPLIQETTVVAAVPRSVVQVCSTQKAAIIRGIPELKLVASVNVDMLYNSEV
jgi:hypothetical protein